MDKKFLQPLPSFGDKLDKFFYLGKKPTNKRKFRKEEEEEEKKEEKGKKCFRSNNNHLKKAQFQIQDKFNTKQLDTILPSSTLKPLKPLLASNLRCVFVGFNPGIETARVGHYYAHRSNRFWKFLYESGCVDERLSCTDDQMVLQKYQYGFHDLVPRPTKGISELSNAEMLAGVPILEKDLSKVRPRVVAIIGKGIWEAIYRYKMNRRLNPKSFKWGIQYNNYNDTHGEEGENSMRKTSRCCFLNSCIVVVLPSTSGLVVSPSREEMLVLWKQLHMTIINASESDDLKPSS